MKDVASLSIPLLVIGIACVAAPARADVIPVSSGSLAGDEFGAHLITAATVTAPFAFTGGRAYPDSFMLPEETLAGSGIADAVIVRRPPEIRFSGRRPRRRRADAARYPQRPMRDDGRRRRRRRRGQRPETGAR